MPVFSSFKRAASKLRAISSHFTMILTNANRAFFWDTLYIYRVAHGIRTLFKDMPLTSATSKNMIAGMDRLAMELSFNHQKNVCHIWNFGSPHVTHKKMRFFSIFRFFCRQISSWDTAK